MRQQQQRSRNRNRGRKSSNPLSRNFESNGPDVKIRGNASHIAEKYSVLARDALTSGDTVMAENYYQHAEHYFRIIAATQSNNPQATAQNNPQRENASGVVSGAVGGSGNSQPDEADDNASGDGGNKPQPELARDRTEGGRTENATEKATENATENVTASDNSADSEIETQDQRNTSDGADSENEQPEKAAPVRNRRNGRRPATTRRTSRTASEKTARSTSKEVLSEGASSEKLSKDAALLPSSLIGKSSENEAEATPPVSEE